MTKRSRTASSPICPPTSNSKNVKRPKKVAKRINAFKDSVSLDKIPIVQLTDTNVNKAIISSAQAKINELEKSILTLKTEPANLHNKFNQISPLLALCDIKTITNSNPTITNDTLHKSETFIELISNEVTERITRQKQKIIYDIPDPISIENIHHLICSYGNHDMSAIQIRRLQKKSVKNTCTTLITFTTKKEADIFQQREHLLKSLPNFGCIRISNNLSPTQRRVIRRKLTKVVPSPVLQPFEGESNTNLTDTPPTNNRVDSPIKPTAPTPTKLNGITQTIRSSNPIDLDATTPNPTGKLQTNRGTPNPKPTRSLTKNKIIQVSPRPDSSNTVIEMSVNKDTELKNSDPKSYSFSSPRLNPLAKTNSSPSNPLRSTQPNTSTSCFKSTTPFNENLSAETWVNFPLRQTRPTRIRVDTPNHYTCWQANTSHLDRSNSETNRPISLLGDKPSEDVIPHIPYNISPARENFLLAMEKSHPLLHLAYLSLLHHITTPIPANTHPIPFLA